MSNVYVSSKKRISRCFDLYQNVWLSFSGGKDSTICFHIAAKEARKRGVKLNVLYIDLEAQYLKTIQHIHSLILEYKDCINFYWCCLPLKLRNATSEFKPFWKCWNDVKQSDWVRDIPHGDNFITVTNSNKSIFHFFVDGMEFEEFIEIFNQKTLTEKDCNIIGIRTEESYNRFRALHGDRVKQDFYCCKKNEVGADYIYPIYDWKFTDVWKYHSINVEDRFNPIYELMFKAGVPLKQMRLCQPFGEEQRKGLHLYHILEPKTWGKLLGRVNGVNSFSKVNLQNIKKPQNLDYKQFTKTLLSSLPPHLKNHFTNKFIEFLKKWKNRDYSKEIPLQVPIILQQKNLAPSWKALSDTILQNDYWCKRLGFTQPKSAAYGKYLEMKKTAQKLGKNISDIDINDKAV